MNDINPKLILNIEIKNHDLLSELNFITMELSLTFDDFMLFLIAY
jgi:hypothetical protein